MYPTARPLLADLERNPACQGNGDPMNPYLRLLQVDDSEGDAAMMVRILEHAGYEVYAERVDDPEAMRDALRRADWDIIISDHRMSQFDAPAALRVLHEAGKDIPFIIVSG